VIFPFTPAFKSDAIRNWILFSGQDVVSRELAACNRDSKIRDRVRVPNGGAAVPVNAGPIFRMVPGWIAVVLDRRLKFENGSNVFCFGRTGIAVPMFTADAIRSNPGLA
jgi:hypothetical protein